VKIWSVHTRAHAAPVLIREGFSWGAFFFGPIWLLAHRAWIAGVLVLCAWVLAALLPGPLRPVPTVALAWATGVFGTDWRRWSLERRGFTLVHIVAARTADAAFARLMAARPDLAAEAAAS
jgi:hypothetical protein